MPLKFINKIDFTNIIETNLLSPFFLTQQLIKRKKLLQPSSIVFMSSISGPIVGSKGNLMYSASKSALNGMIKTLALELSDLKIRVNSVSAGMVLTEMWEDGNGGVTTDQLKQDEKKYPFGYGTPKDISSIISFLISSDSSWITGSTIVADGGFTIQ
jgi:NAD(P)-dependent dehydrogenase (short-subunit alcohol dehydrogenase family)